MNESQALRAIAVWAVVVVVCIALVVAGWIATVIVVSNEHRLHPKPACVLADVPKGAAEPRYVCDH